ncbi:WD40 repeat-containing protein HOS15 isoform X2 [Daucus carota subsp. sativus]
MVPPGALVKCITKGLQYLEMEANLSKRKADLDEDFSFIRPLDLITKNVNELRQMITERRKNRQKHVVKVINRKDGSRSRGVSEKGKLANEKEHEKYKHLGQSSGNAFVKDTEMVSAEEDKQLEIFGGSRPMHIATTPTPKHYAYGVLGVDVTILEGHASEVCACAWSPDGSLLASGSVDSTARIWKMAERINGGKSGDGNPNVFVLEHAQGRRNKNKIVTSVDWNGDGSLLATASYDGDARIWTLDGELKSTLRKHKNAVISIKWNKTSDYILTGSLDKTAIVWDVETNEVKQQFELHSGHVLDIDWRNNVSFAASTNKLIHVCKIGMNYPVKTFYGHQSEVNSIKWDPTGSLLASSSDDYTLKIWSLKQDNYIHDFTEHRKGVSTSRWSPTGQGTDNPNKQVLLASASFDSTVKLWDVEQGKLLSNFTGHRDAVYSIAFSPDGEYLASGCKDKSIHIWSVKTGKIVKSFKADGSIFEVCWNKEGDKVAACTNRKTVLVMDFRM